MSFQSWRCSSKPSLFWLRGSSGTGKTTLTSLVVDSFLHHLRPSNTVVVYFYTKREDNPSDILRSFLRQLILMQQDPGQFVDKHFPKDSDLSYGESLRHIEEMVKRQETVTFIIDAVDRCGATDTIGAQTFITLLEDLSRVMEKSTRPIKLFVSSHDLDDKIARFYNTISSSHSPYTISANRQPPDDVQRFIEYEVRNWSRSQFLPLEDDAKKVEDAKNAIIKAVSVRAERMFLWVVHVLRSIFRNNHNLRTLNDVEGEIMNNRLPDTINDLYDQTYNVIYSHHASESGREAGRALKLLFCSKKYLSSYAFIDAVRRPSKMAASSTRYYEEAIANLVSSCRGFIVHDRINDIIRFQHPSVEDYLRGRQADYETAAHALMAQACLGILSFIGSRTNSFHQKISELGLCSDDESEPGSPSPRDYETTSADRAEWIPASAVVSSDDESNRGRSRSRSVAEASTEPLGGVLVSVSYGPDRRSPSRASSRLSSRSQSISRPRSRSGSPRSDGTNDMAFNQPRESLRRRTRPRLDKRGPIQDFHEYAAIFWATHYQACHLQISTHSPKLEVEALLASNLYHKNSNFNLWIRDVQRLLSERPFGFYDAKAENELQDCIIPASTPFHVACVYGFTDIVRLLCGYMNTSDTEDSYSGSVVSLSDEEEENNNRSEPLHTLKNKEGMTGLHLSCKFNRLETVKCLARLENPTMDFEEADKNEKTPLMYAIESAREPGLVRFVRKKTGKPRGPPLARALTACFMNPWCGEELTKMLIWTAGKGYKKLEKESKTHEVAVAACSCGFATSELLDAVADTSSKGAVLKALHNESKRSKVVGWPIDWPRRKKVWDWLMKPPLTHRVRSSITPFLDLAAAAGDIDLLAYLLDKSSLRGSDNSQDYIMINIRAVLQAAAESRSRPDEVVATVFEHSRWDMKVVDQSILLAALENPETRKPLMERLLQNLDSEIDWEFQQNSLWQRIMEAAAQRTDVGVITVKALNIQLTDTWRLEIIGILAEALSIGNLDMVDLFLELSREMSRNEVWRWQMCSKHVFFAVAKFLAPRSVWFKRFAAARKRGATTKIYPRDVSNLDSLADEWDRVAHDSLRKILVDGGTSNYCYRCGIPQILNRRRDEEKNVLKTLFDQLGPRAKELLMKQFPDILVVSEDMVLNTVSNTVFGHRILRLLESLEATNKALFVKQSVLIKAAESGSLDTIKFLLGNQPQRIYSQEFRMAAACNPDASVVRFFYESVTPEDISLDELENAAKHADFALECVMAKRGNTPSPISSMALTYTIARHCRRSRNLHEALEKNLAKEPSSQAGVEKLVAEAAENPHGLEMARFVLKRYQWTDKRIKVSEDLLVSAAKNPSFAPEMLRLLLNECEDRRVQEIITSRVLEAAEENESQADESLRILRMELNF